MCIRGEKIHRYPISDLSCTVDGDQVTTKLPCHSETSGKQKTTDTLVPEPKVPWSQNGGRRSSSYNLHLSLLLFKSRNVFCLYIHGVSQTVVPEGLSGSFTGFTNGGTRHRLNDLTHVGLLCIHLFSLTEGLSFLLLVLSTIPYKRGKKDINL